MKIEKQCTESPQNSKRRKFSGWEFTLSKTNCISAAEGVISAGLKNLRNEEKFERWGVERSFFIYITIHFHYRSFNRKEN